MRKYRKGAGSDVRVLYGIELREGLTQFEPTRPLAAPLETVNGELESVFLERVQKGRERPALRARLRFAEYGVDQLLKELSRSSQVTDGGRRGPLSVALFPEGLTPIIAAAGARQIEPTKLFIQRFVELRAPGIESLRESYLPRLKQALDQLIAAAAAYQQLNEQLGVLLSRERILRDEHELQVIRTMGHVEAAYPRDKAVQRLIFPAVDSATSSDDEQDDAVDDSAQASSGA